jgi:nucleoside-diphosphate-sugar epimerase
MIKKILITGGGGYVGTLLVQELLKKNYIITVVDTFWFGNYLTKNKNLKILKKNILNLKDSDFKKIDCVIHLASIANDNAADIDQKFAWETSCLGTKIICDFAKKNNIKKFIYASSGSVYGIKKEKQVTEKVRRKFNAKYIETGKPIVLGELALMKQNNQVGTVKEIRGKKVIVQLGAIPITVDLTDLIAVQYREEENVD